MSGSRTLSFALQDRLASDRYLLYILLAHVPFVGFIVPLGHDTGGFALGASVLIGIIAVGAWMALQGSRACSAIFAACLMAFSAVMIQARLGQIEMHFHIFAALALVITYRDWLPIVSAAGVIAAHHLILTALQQSGAQFLGMPVMLFNHAATFGMAFLHAGFVVFESSVLIFFAIRMAAERREALQIISVVRTFGDSKDLTGRLDHEGGSHTALHFNDMMSQFGELIEKVRHLATHLRTSSADLTSVSEKTSGIIREQHGQTDQAAAATNQMAATIQEVAHNAQLAAEAAGRASEAASEGRTTADHAVELTEATHGTLGDASSTVERLVEKVGSIQSFVASINEISDQTNLLALNAAIEAARAGEHGRGFAVVADEVRNLSRRTQEFTQEIGSTVEELSDSAEAALAAIDMGLTRSSETTRSIRQTVEAIARIEAAIADVNGMNEQIASASEQQAVASSQISESVQLVASRNSDIVGEAEATRTMAERLESTILDVESLVRDYRTA